MWLSGKVVQIKTWEIKLLDDESEELGMTLRDAMMELRHPANKCFNLFHSIDKHFRNQCYVLTVLKSAESQAHAMIAAMLPYLLWQHVKGKQGPKSSLKKWFNPMACCRAEDAFWCPKDECIKNQSNLMLAVELEDDNTLYWEEEATKPPSPKCKRPQAEEESLEDSILTVNTEMSAKKIPKSAIKNKQAMNGKQKTQTRFASDSQMVASQATSISQLTEMVSAVQQENQTIMSCFDQLMEQIAKLLSAQKHPTHSSCARGHRSESGSKP